MFVRVRVSKMSPMVATQFSPERSPRERVTEVVRRLLADRDIDRPFTAEDDLREVGCEVLTMGQYLRPTPKHLPVVEYITPEQFDYYGDIARGKGFLYVASGPLVRSSYHAADFHPVVRR